MAGWQEDDGVIFLVFRIYVRFLDDTFTRVGRGNALTSGSTYVRCE